MTLMLFCARLENGVQPNSDVVLQSGAEPKVEDTNKLVRGVAQDVNLLVKIGNKNYDLKKIRLKLEGEDIKVEEDGSYGPIVGDEGSDDLEPDDFKHQLFSKEMISNCEALQNIGGIDTRMKDGNTFSVLNYIFKDGEEMFTSIENIQGITDAIFIANKQEINFEDEGFANRRVQYVILKMKYMKAIGESYISFKESLNKKEKKDANSRLRDFGRVFSRTKSSIIGMDNFYKEYSKKDWKPIFRESNYMGYNYLGCKSLPDLVKMYNDLYRYRFMLNLYSGNGFMTKIRSDILEFEKFKKLEDDLRYVLLKSGDLYRKYMPIFSGINMSREVLVIRDLCGEALCLEKDLKDILLLKKDDKEDEKFFAKYIELKEHEKKTKNCIKAFFKKIYPEKDDVSTNVSAGELMEQSSREAFIIVMEKIRKFILDINSKFNIFMEEEINTYLNKICRICIDEHKRKDPIRYFCDLEKMLFIYSEDKIREKIKKAIDCIGDETVFIDDENVSITGELEGFLKKEMKNIELDDFILLFKIQSFIKGNKKGCSELCYAIKLLIKNYLRNEDVDNLREYIYSRDSIIAKINYIVKTENDTNFKSFFKQSIARIEGIYDNELGSKEAFDIFCYKEKVLAGKAKLPRKSMLGGIVKQIFNNDNKYKRKLKEALGKIKSAVSREDNLIENMKDFGKEKESYYSPSDSIFNKKAVRSIEGTGLSKGEGSSFSCYVANAMFAFFRLLHKSANRISVEGNTYTKTYNFLRDIVVNVNTLERISLLRNRHTIQKPKDFEENVDVEEFHNVLV